MNIDNKLADLKIAFVGDLGWLQYRDLLVLKFKECRTEADLVFLLKAMLAAMFPNASEIDKARQQLGLELLSKKEKNEIKAIENNDKQNISNRKNK